MSYVVINENYCDNSQYCWFLENCPFHVFSFENGKINICETKCKGCGECVGHCEVVMIAEDEIQKKQCIDDLSSPPLKNNSNCKVFGTEPYATDNMYDVNIDSSEQIEKIKNYIKNSEKNLIIELSCNNSLICRYAGIPFGTLKDVILESIGNFEYKTIFTGNDEKAFQSFCDFFCLSPKDVSKAPLLVFYNKGVYGVFGHGPLHIKNFDLENFKDEMRKIGENYENRRN